MGSEIHGYLYLPLVSSGTGLITLELRGEASQSLSNSLQDEHLCEVGRLIPAAPVTQGQYNSWLRKPLILLKPLTPCWCFTHFISFSLILRMSNPQEVSVITTHFIDKETEAQGASVTCPNRTACG